MAQYAPLKPVTVLIVENEALIRIELAAQLAEGGMTVLTAVDADQAIEMLDAWPEITLLLTDIKMPGSMDGVRLAHHVRRRWPPVRIIVASGMLGTVIDDLPLNSAFLSKPFGMEELTGVIAQVMGGRSPPRLSA